MSGIPAGAGALLGKRLGKYEILALLALGGTAEIYLARIGGAAGFEKYVVVKCLHDHLADDTEFVKMFLDEARLAAYLDHSNIVQTMELGEHENRYYMVMEFLAGLSLAMVVRRATERLSGGRIPVALALNMVAQTCAGLHYAHDRTANGKPLNIVHRDISPQNLVISFEGVVKIVDFGIAKAEMRETRTRSGTIKGKFAYMSPEQCVANNVDRRTDVFAAGVIAHELLTGKRLFKRPSPYETYQAVIECAAPLPSAINHELDPALDPIIMKAVCKDKEGRYPTAEAFGDAILGYLHHRGKGSGPNEVSRFFDASFGQEIEEHGARMRELISGRDFSADTGASWGDEEEEARKSQRPQRAETDANETVDFRKPEQSQSFDSGGLEDVQRASQSELSEVLDGIGNRAEDDEIPAERTRIENNPMEKVNELEAAMAAQRPMMPPSGALPLPPAPTGPVPKSGRHSEAANLPTMLAGPSIAEAPTTADGQPYIEGVDPNGRTIADPNRPIMGPNGAPESATARPSSPTTAAPPIRPPNRPSTPPAGRPAIRPSGSQPPPMGPGSTPPAMGPMPQPPSMGHPSSQPPPMGPMPQPPPMGHPSSQPPPMGHPSSQPPPYHQNLPLGYPTMSPQLGAQISPQLQQKLGAHPVRHPHPSHPPPDSGQQHAASLMSPVGPNYGHDVDWAAAAAKPAKAIAPWMLALLFVGALGIALGITIAIATAIR